MTKLYPIDCAFHNVHISDIEGAGVVTLHLVTGDMIAKQLQ